MQRMQLETTRPFRKRCWQSVVTQKVDNQAECLRLLERAGYEPLRALLPEITSGDGTNVEARAAKLYLSPSFRRSLYP